MAEISKYLSDFSHLAFPFNCLGCDNTLDENEQSICDHCKESLPQTRYWEYPDNHVAKLFWGKIPLTFASSYLFFIKDGLVQQLMHQLKYNGKKEVGAILGQLFGRVLKDGHFTDVDVVVPVPLHADKLKKRGFNQCDFIAAALARELDKSYNNRVVQRLRANETQTKKGRYERWINVKELFRVTEPQFVIGKHVLLIDDVVTTGSTLEACADAILQVPDTKVSVATLACPSPY